MQTTWEQLREAIKSTGNPEALRLFDEAASSMASQQDSTISFVAMSLTRFVQKTGEESLEELFRRRYLPVVQEWIKTTPGPKESAERFARLMQHPLTKTTLDEEPERYVVRLDPCRTGGRLRRNIAAGAYDAQQQRDSAAGFEISPEPVNMYRAEIEEFSQALLDGRPSSLSAEAGLRSQKILAACYASAAAGRAAPVG